MLPRRYIDRVVANYALMSGCKPKQMFSSPLEKNDHPELDTSDELDEEGIKTYQGLVGAIQ